MAERFPSKVFFAPLVSAAVPLERLMRHRPPPGHWDRCVGETPADPPASPWSLADHEPVTGRATKKTEIGTHKWMQGKSLDGAIYCHAEVERKLLLNCGSQWQWQDGLVQDLRHHSFSSTLSDWRAGVWSIKKCLNRNQGAKMLPATFISFIVTNQADVTLSLVLSASASSKMPRIWLSSLEPSLLARLLVESAHLELVWAPVLHLHSAGSHLLTLALSRLNMPCPVTQVRSPANPRH